MTSRWLLVPAIPVNSKQTSEISDSETSDDSCSPKRKQQENTLNTTLENTQFCPMHPLREYRANDSHKKHLIFDTATKSQDR